MKQFGKIEQFLIMILGKEEYELFISEVVREHKERLSMNNYEGLIYVYGILIFLIGMDRNAIKKDRFKVRLNKVMTVEIEIEEICKKYSKYIEKVEKYKTLLFNEIQKI